MNEAKSINLITARKVVFTEVKGFVAADFA